MRILAADQSFLRVWHDGYSTLHRASGSKEDSAVQWVVEVAAHPAPAITWRGPDGETIPEGEEAGRGREVQTVVAKTSRSLLRLTRLRVEDSGEYTVTVDNGEHQQTETFTLIVTDRPKVSLAVLEPSEAGLYQHGAHQTLRCVARGYPAPKLSWTFKPCESYLSCAGDTQHLAATKEDVGWVAADSFNILRYHTFDNIWLFIFEAVCGFKMLL